MKQLIIARKDLGMSPGKLAAQVSHASMAFLAEQIRSRSYRVMKEGIKRYAAFDGETGQPLFYKRSDLTEWAKEAFAAGDPYFYAKPADGQESQYILERCEPEYGYEAKLFFDAETMLYWFNGAFTKIVCEAKNKTHLMKAVQHATELGMKEGEDFFLIRDNCYTELTPEEVDENGVGRTLTCLGFRPLPDELCIKISRKYQLYK